MKKLYILLTLSIAVHLLAEEQQQSYTRRNTWAETMNANSGETIPADLKRDFPAQSIGFHNIFGWKYKGWPSITNLTEFEKVLHDDILEPQSRHFADEIKELDAIAQLAPEQKIHAILNLFEKILLSEHRRFLKELPSIAFIRRNGYGMTGTNGTMFSRRTTRGSALCILDPATGNVRTIFETTDGFILDIKPSYDAMKLVMSYKSANNEPFHIWEINIDGTGLRQVTSGPYHDFNPVYYPDGRIIFSSSRVESYSLCQDFLACALYSVKPDGSNLRRFDFTTLNSNTANIMHDGSIICTRWEYQDKNIFSWQGLWTINPDGRQLKLYYGNTLTVPNSLYGPQPIPGSDKVLITMAATTTRLLVT